MKKALWMLLSLGTLAGCQCPEKTCPECPKAEPQAVKEVSSAITYDLQAANTDSLTFTEGQDIVLPPPHKSGGEPINTLLSKRKTDRNMGEKSLTIEMLSDLLWMATGQNREDGRWTIATAINARNMLTYVALKNGLFLYDPAAHALKPIKNADLRKDTGKQPFVGVGGVELCFVADDNKWPRPVEAGQHRDYMNAMHAGAASQDVYLFAAANGLSTVIRAAVDREDLAQKMGLVEGQTVMACQSVAFPAQP